MLSKKGIIVVLCSIKGLSCHGIAGNVQGFVSAGEYYFRQPRLTEAKLINIDDDLQTEEKSSVSRNYRPTIAAKVETQLPSAPVAQNPMLPAAKVYRSLTIQCLEYFFFRSANCSFFLVGSC